MDMKIIISNLSFTEKKEYIEEKKRSMSQGY